MERNLVYGPGPLQGQPLRLRKWQKGIIYRAYEVRLDATPSRWRRWRRVVVGLGRGNAKTELLAGIALAELAGPVQFDGWNEDGSPRGRMRTSPTIALGALSWEQANFAYGAARDMLTDGRLAEFFDCWDQKIQFKDGRSGELKRIAAVAKTNEGDRLTFAGKDETHELTGNQKRLAVVLDLSVAKRASEGSWTLEITTAGRKGNDSVGENAYEIYQAQRRDGVSDSDQTLVLWWEASEKWDLDDPEQLRAAIREANPAADDWIDVEIVASEWRQPGTPTHEFRRYRLNQWVELDDTESWLHDHPGAWEKCLAPELELMDGQSITAAVDMARKHDCAAVVWGGRVPSESSPLGFRRVVRAKVWHPPPGGVLDAADIIGHLRSLRSQYNVRRVAYDPAYFEFPAQQLADEGFDMEEVPQSPERMVPRYGAAYDWVTSGEVAHDGDEELAAHVMAAAKRDASERGWVLSKMRSRRKIDACVAMAMQLFLDEEVSTEPEYPVVQVW